MKKSLVFLLLAFAAATPMVVGTQEAPPPVKKFQTGAKVTPIDKVIAALKSGKANIHAAKAAPAQVIVVPKRLSMWGNSQFGCCVTSESCFAASDYSVYVYNADAQIFVTEATAIKWARDHGVLNGATLLEVLEAMQDDGIKDENGTLRKQGTASAVDYRNEAVLQSAIAQGPVDIAIDSSALPSGAGNKSGWYSFDIGPHRNTDHCVSIWGYGTAEQMFKALNVPVPANAPTGTVYGVFTWSTQGVVTHKWLLNTCVEAWVRNPTVVGLDPTPDPAPKTVTVKVASVAGSVNVPIKFVPTASGGTSPYIFIFDYGDGVQDASGSHSYSQAGSYKATVTAIDSKGQTGAGTCTATVGSGPSPIPGPGGFQITVPQDLPAGTYHLVDPTEIDELQRIVDRWRNRKAKK